MLASSAQSRCLQLPCFFLKIIWNIGSDWPRWRNLVICQWMLCHLMFHPLAKFRTFYANCCGYIGSSKDLIVNWVHPLFLKFKAVASKEENPTLWETMHGFFADKYWKAAITAIESIEAMNAWEVVDCMEDITILQSTWAFKLDHFPDGLVKSSNPGFPGKISRSKAFISLKPMLLLFNWQ